MSEPLSLIWDGETHWMEVGEHFLDSGAELYIERWEEDEEEDVLSPFESPTMIPVVSSIHNEREEYHKMFPLAKTEQAWGSLSINMTAMATIVGINKKQYQHNNHLTKESSWSFTSEEFVTERF